VFIWVVVISQILSRANDMVAYLSYAAGYATGNYVGILLEQQIAYGIVLCRIYTRKNGAELVQIINKLDFGATLTHGLGSTDAVDIIETVIDRKEMKTMERTLNEFDKNIFYVVEDVRTRQNGIFPKRKSILAQWRLGK
jgi:uncharacterized protein YebE (UPF0316 family)